MVIFEFYAKIRCHCTCHVIDDQIVDNVDMVWTMLLPMTTSIDFLRAIFEIYVKFHARGSEEWQISRSSTWNTAPSFLQIYRAGLGYPLWRTCLQFKNSTWTAVLGLLFFSALRKSENKGGQFWISPEWHQGQRTRGSEFRFFYDTGKQMFKSFCSYLRCSPGFSILLSKGQQ